MQSGCILSWQDGIKVKPGRLGIRWRPENIHTNHFPKQKTVAEAVTSPEGSGRRLSRGLKQSFTGRLEIGKHWRHGDQEVLARVRRGRRRRHRESTDLLLV